MEQPANMPAQSVGLHGSSREVIVGNYRVPVGGDLVTAIDAPGAGFCTACLTGKYPVPIPVQLAAAGSGRAAPASATA